MAYTYFMRLSFPQILLIILLILLPLFVSMLPVAIQFSKSPPDRIFMGLHRWSEDYYSYLHLINQGLNGHLQTVNKITSIKHTPTFVHSEYTLLGLIARPFGLNSVLTYHFSRFVLGFIFLITAFYFYLYIFKSLFKRTNYLPFLSFFLAFFVPGFIHLDSIQPLVFSPYLSWWTELDVVRRATILPHYLMGSILFLLIIIFFLKTLQKPTFKLYAAVFVFSFLLSFVHPVDFLILVCTLGLYTLLANFNVISKSIKNFVPLLCVVLAGTAPFLYYKYAFSLPFWRFVTSHGTTTQYNIPLFDFIMSQGLILPLAFLEILLFIVKIGGWQPQGDPHRAPAVHKSADEEDGWGMRLTGPALPAPSDRGEPTDRPTLFLFSWLFVQTLFFFKLYEIFNFDRLRTLHAPYYIPLAFFAGIFLIKIYKSIKSKYFLLFTFIFISTVITIPLLYKSITNQILEVSDFKSFSPFTYPTIKQYEAWEFLRKNTPENSFITTGYEAKFLLPAVAHNKIAFGANFENDPSYGLQNATINQLYSNTLDPSLAYDFLLKNHISYIYWGYQEKSLGGNLNNYQFLKKIFENGEVSIFAVK